MIQIRYEHFSELTVFFRVDFSRLLICFLGAHREAFGAIELSVAIHLLQGISME